jgi:hypothetical protein
MTTARLRVAAGDRRRLLPGSHFDRTVGGVVN